MTKRMSLLDSGFIRMERHESPQHGSTLLIFRRPDDAPADYIQQLAAYLRRFPVTGSRFNWRLAKGLSASLLPAWETLPSDEVDLDYHFRHSALPAPGGELELGLLVSRLVTHPLDLNRPPWEFHLIEGLHSGRFALFLKMHHSLLDGMSAMTMLKNWLSEDPTVAGTPPLWANTMPPRPKLIDQLAPGAGPRERALVRSVKSALASASAIARALGQTFAAARGNGHGLVAPYRPPHSVFNGTITQRRRVSTQRLDFDRVATVAAKIDGTVNDAIALVFGTALRRYLLEIDAQQARSLTAGILTSLRATVSEEAAAQAGNLISFIFADLATDIDDIAVRSTRITTATRAGKEHLLGLGRNAMGYSMLMLTPFLLTTLTGTGHRLPMFSVGLSNVPGTRVPLYWNGAQAEALHATTIVANGQALVVTVTSWTDALCFTFTACPDTVPHPQRLSVLLAESLPEVEAALGI